MAKFNHHTLLTSIAWAFCWWLCICGNANQTLYAQTSVEELLIQLQGDINNKEKAHIYNELSRGYLEYDLPDSTIFYAQGVIKLAEQYSIREENALAHLYLAEAYYSKRMYKLADDAYIKTREIAKSSKLSSLELSALEGQASLTNQIGDSDKAKEYLLTASKLGKKLNDTTSIVRLYNQLSTIYHASGELDSAIYYFETLIPIKEATKDTMGMISDFSELGVLLLDQGEYTDAQKYFFDARDLAEASQDSMLLMGLYAELGKIYLDHQQWSTALEYTRNAASIALNKQVKYTEGLSYQYIGKAWVGLDKKDSAQYAYQKSLEIFQLLNNDIEIAKNYIAIGRLLEEEQNISEAIPYLEKALNLYRRLGEKQNNMEVHNALAGIYLRLDKPLLAIQYAQKSEGLARELNSAYGLQVSSKILADAYGNLKNFAKAYEYHIQYSEYKDDIFNADNAERILELETKYESEKKDRELAEQEATIAKNDQLLLEKTYQSYFLFAGLVILALALGFLFYSYQKRQQLHQQNIAILKKEQEAANLRAVIAGEEQERKRMASELHDGLGATLVSAKMMFDAVENELPKVQDTSTYHQANTLLDQACNEVREISHNLMPSMLEHHGLEETIREMCAVLNKTNKIEVSFIPYGLDASIDNTIQISVYRIVQELLKNILKHAEANEAIVQLTVEDEDLNLIVEDDGKGFELSKMNQQKGMGLDNIRLRVAYLEGTCEIETRKDEGTTFNIHIPIKTPKTT